MSSTSLFNLGSLVPGGADGLAEFDETTSVVAYLGKLLEIAGTVRLRNKEPVLRATANTVECCMTL
jgi:hypothetical protein